MPVQIIPNLVQGVSQQATQNRRDAQCESQFDTVNSVLEGVAARPHADLVKFWAGRNLTNSLFSETSHGTEENYLTGVGPNGVPFAIDLADGTDCTVSNSAPDYGYLTAGSLTPAEKLRAQVVDDFTFIANRQRTVSMSPTTTPAKVNEALVFVRSTSFRTGYTVYLGGPAVATTAFLTDQDLVTPTDTIAAALTAGLHGNSGYAVTRLGAVLHITRYDGQPFEVIVSDGNGDTNMLAFNGSVGGFEKLPAKAPTGTILRVSGDQRTGDDDYYVKFVGGQSTGVWEETTAPGTQQYLDASTMPHALVCTGYRQFNFRRLSFSSRVAGDAETAKDPGFVGKQIVDMIYHQRRLGLIHPAGAVFSKTDYPFTFFPDTVQTVLATSPVDLKVSSGDKRGASVLDFGLQAQENLYLWAQKCQFRVSSGQDPFKQDTVEVLPSMSYQYAKRAYPLSVGNFLFLAQDAGAYASLRALLYAQTRLAGDVDVTNHVGQYIASGVSGLTASETLRYVFLQSVGNKRVLYLFNYTYDTSEGFIQTAINTWRIPGGDILWASLKDNDLRVLQQRPEGVAYLRFDLTPQKVDPVAGAQYTTRLDLRLDETKVSGLAYNATTGQSTFTLPYKPTVRNVMVVTRADKAGGYTRGRTFPVVSVSDYTVTVKGDLRGYQFYVGQQIIAERTDSEFCVRTEKGAAPVDALTVNKHYLTLSNSAYTRAEVMSPNKQTKSYEFTGQVLGGSGAQTGTPIPKNGALQTPINEKASNVRLRLVNDSFLPSFWQSAAYEYSAVGWSGVK